MFGISRSYQSMGGPPGGMHCVLLLPALIWTIREPQMIDNGTISFPPYLQFASSIKRVGCLL